jgi:hypothetical protein
MPTIWPGGGDALVAELGAGAMVGRRSTELVDDGKEEQESEVIATSTQMTIRD